MKVLTKVVFNIIVIIAVSLMINIVSPTFAQDFAESRIPFVEIHLERLPEGSRGSVQCLGPIEVRESTRTSVEWSCHSFPEQR